MRRWISTSRGRKPSCPSASGRSTSTGCTRTTASSSRSSSRCCSTATSRRETTSSTRSRVRERLSSRRSSPGSTRRESTSPRSTVSSCASRRRPTTSPQLGEELREVAGRVDSLPRRRARTRGYLGEWYAPQAVAELLAFRELIPEYRHTDVLRVILSRAARSARRAAHFDLEAPKQPQREEYWCHKHRRQCRPVESATGFLRRYTLDTLARIEKFARMREVEREATVLHVDAREAELLGPFDGILTSPPYPGLIDYHEQHRYAYELLELDDRREREIGAAASGTSLACARGLPQRHRGRARQGVREALGPGAPILVVVNDRRDLYPDDPREGRPPARSEAAAPRQPPHGPAGGRVLRGRPRRARGLRLKPASRTARSVRA